ncbi:MAG: TylF/MycF/NovP-related O-methyltransferase [Patescibacteria group bacterium]
MVKRFINLVQFFILKPRAIFEIFNIRRIRGYTMQTIAGVYQMQDHIQEIKKNNIKGAIVETGCWKGGLGAYMASFGLETWLFDSFEGLPEMTEKDEEIAVPKGLALHQKTGYIAVSEENAKQIAFKLGTKPRIIKGWFNETLIKNKEKIGPIAILRLDGDTYSSTLEALEALYDNVVIGGVVVVDDFYDFKGCRQALYDFFQTQGIAPAIITYPFGRAYFIKNESR